MILLVDAYFILDTVLKSDSLFVYMTVLIMFYEPAALRTIISPRLRDNKVF